MKPREKLMELLCEALEDGCIGHCNHPYCFRIENTADYLINHGVTVKGRCKYRTFFELDKTYYCSAYSKSKRKDGKYWAHYPECKSKNCPLVFPELLEGAELNDEGGQ